MIKLRHIFLLGLTTLLGGCKMALLDPKGIIALSEKNLLIDATLLMLIVVIPVILMSFIFAWKYRRKNKTAQYSPNWSESTALEVVCWSIPCVIIAILATMTWISTHKLDPYRPLDVKQKPIIIQAIALNWKWLFIYPNQHIAAVNYLRIPVNTPVRFLVTADAPMNSLEIPRLAGQIYAMTGMRTKLNLMATSTGQFVGFSTNFSGEGFSGMRFKVDVTSKEQYEKWVQTVQHAPKQLSMLAYHRLATPSEYDHKQLYSNPAKHLFNDVIMKYMGPQMKLHGDK